MTTDPAVQVTIITSEGVQSGVLTTDELGDVIHVSPRSWAPEMLVARDEWAGNSLRFRTKEESDLYGRDLLMRWTIPTDYRSVESDDEPTHQIVDGVLSRIDE